jgi:predicted Fe-Mo cluster-binding NifX family protein
MRIAIPTKDGLTINEHLSPAKGFLILTIQLGEVVQQEMRWNLQNEMITSDEGTYYNLADCEKVIVRELSFDQLKYLQSHNKEVIKTEETIITKVLMQYLNSTMQKETNTCCCP